jgi:hypothetical protein
VRLVWEKRESRQQSLARMEGTGISDNEVNGVSQQQGEDQRNAYIPIFFPLNEKVQQRQKRSESKVDSESIHCNECIRELGSSPFQITSISFI